MKRRGFSLVEVLVALLVAGVVMTAALMAFRSANQVAVDERTVQKFGDRLTEAVTQWLRDTTSMAPVAGDAGHLVLSQDDVFSEARWAAYEATSDGTSTWHRAISVSWSPQKTPHGTALQRGQAPLLLPDDLSGSTNVVVSAIETFTMEAYDGETWHPTWDTSSEDKDAPGYDGQWPRALRLTLRLIDGREEVVTNFLPVGHQVRSTVERQTGPAPETGTEAETETPTGAP